MKPDLEDYLWNNISMAGQGGRSPRDVIHEMVEKRMIQSPKQAWATLLKWSRKGLYTWGVSLDLGWKEKEARG